jgi:hypothetical protein
VALLSRALGIPAVVGLGDVTQRVRPGDRVLLDGSNGTVTINPDAATTADFNRLMHREKELMALLEEDRQLPGAMKDGTPLKIVANTQPGVPFGTLAAFGAQRFDGMGFPYLWLDATFPKCRDNGHVQSKGVVTAIACGEDGQRRFVGFDAVDTESAPSWKGFLRSLRRRGVHGVKFVTSDDHGGLVEAIAEVFPGAAWQRCIVHLERDVAGWFSGKSDKAVALAAMKAVFAESDPKMVRAAYRQACEVVRALSPRCAELLEDAEADALAYLDFPAEHHAKLRTNNVQERANAEIKRRTKVVGVFPSEKSMLRLVGSVLLDVNEDWACGRFIDASTLAGLERDASDPEPPSAEVVELARKKIEAAIAERRAA